MVHRKKKTFLPKEKPTAKNLQHGSKEENNEESARIKKGRLIVRNLPFKNLTADKLKEFFGKYGNVIDVQLLRLPDGKLKGCGFVEFERRQAAAKAIFHTNGQLMSGRTIVVDWAFPKHTFVEKLKELSKAKVKKGDKKGEDSEELLEFTIDTKPDKYPSDEDEDLDGSNNETDDDELEENDNGSEEIDGDDNNDDLDGDVNSNDDDDDVDEEDDNFDDGSEEDDKKPKVKKTLPSDVDEGKTVFIKNVPFAAKNEDVKKCVEGYGAVVYALVCVDKLTEHSKGSAFVKFKEKTSAENFLKDSKKITLMDQILDVTRAVSRDHLEEEKRKKKTKVKDSRNLYLVREGVIMAGSTAAGTVSAADMAKRLQIEQWKSQILRNLNMFVSRTRLVFHNLPPDYDDAKLRRLVEKHSGPKAIVKEARVMRDRKKFDRQGQGLSKELGFVTFVNHEDALHALRTINNNPDIFSPSRRPIISFSIENREILNLKQKRMEKSRANVMGTEKMSKDLEKLNKKQRRALKRKKKLIAKIQEAKKLKKEAGKGSTNVTTDASPKVTGKKAGKKEPSGPKPTVKNKRKRKSKDGDIPSKKMKLSPERTSTSKNINKKETLQPTTTPAPDKKKKNKVGEDSQNQLKTSVDEFSGVAAEKGKTPKMRSRLKLKKQVEIHQERLKERRKLRKAQRQIKLQKQNKKVREPTIKKKKAKLPPDNLNKLISQYRDKIEKSSSFKKWYDTA